MSLPTAVLAEIVSDLSAKLGSAVAEVRACDSDFGADGTTFKATRPLAVLVTCLGMPSIHMEQEPPLAVFHMAAICIVKEKVGALSPADVAMNLAALTAGHIARSDWQTVYRDPERIRVMNLRKSSSMDGAHVWAVEWFQLVHLSVGFDPATLNRLAEINFTLSLSDSEHVSPAEAQITFPEVP